MTVEYIKVCWCVCVVSVLPGTELAEGLEGGGGHVAESSIITQQQESQHLKPQQHKDMSYAQHDQKGVAG